MFMRRLLLGFALTALLRRSKGATGLHHYHAFGLRIASALELPELHPGDAPGSTEVPADVKIGFERRSGGGEEPDEPSVEVAGSAAILRFEGIRFTVEGGSAIAIAAPAETAERDVRIWLLGTVAAALLHQRGYLPIHANVVALPGGGAAAFAGESGAGKSTLAAWMEAAGHDVLTDDLCAVRLVDGLPCVFSGVPRMKLWPDSLGALGRASDGLEKVAWDLDKYHVPLRRAPLPGSLEPVRLVRIYLLGRAGAGEPFAVRRLSGVDAALGVLANAFRWHLGQRIHGDRATQFDQCLELARHAAVFQLDRSWDLDRFDEDARRIERHLLTPLAQL